MSGRCRQWAANRSAPDPPAGLFRILAKTRSRGHFPASFGCSNLGRFHAGHTAPDPRSPAALTRATSTATGSMSEAITDPSRTLAAAIASTAVPHADIGDIPGVRRPSTVCPRPPKQPRVVPWCPVPKAIAASISRPIRALGQLVGIMRAVDEEPPGLHRVAVRAGHGRPSRFPAVRIPRRAGRHAPPLGTASATSSGPSVK